MLRISYLRQQRSVMLVGLPSACCRPARSSVMVYAAVTQAGLHRAVLCWTRSKGKWCILPGCPADAEGSASDQTHVRKLLRLSAGQRSSTSGSGHCCIATSGDCRIDWTRTLASKITRPQSGWLQYLWFDTRTHLSDIDTKHRWPESVPHICLVEPKQRVVDKAIDQWRARLRACVRAKGKHFDHLINRMQWKHLVKNTFS